MFCILDIMKLIHTCICFLMVVSTKAQDSVSVLRKESFIDSLKNNKSYTIACNYSACFHHTEYRITIIRKGNMFAGRLKIKNTYAGDNPKIIKTNKFSGITAAQLDSLRKFELYLNLYPTEESDGQRYYYYTLTSGNKEKRYFDGIQADPWMKIEGLVKILFPKIRTARL